MTEEDDAALDALVEAEVNALRVEYRKTIPAKIRELEEAAKEKNPAELRTLAHKARGSAGSYGFDDLSKIFAEIEEAAIAIQGGDSSAWHKIANALTRLNAS